MIAIVPEYSIRFTRSTKAVLGVYLSVTVCCWMSLFAVVNTYANNFLDITLFFFFFENNTPLKRYHIRRKSKVIPCLVSVDLKMPVTQG